MRRLRDALSRPHKPKNESRRLTRGLFLRRGLSNSNSDSPLHALAHTEQPELASKGKSRAGIHNEERNNANVSLGLDFPTHRRPNTIRHQRSEAGTAEPDNDKGKQRDELVTRNQTSTLSDLSSPDDLDSASNRALWKSLLRGRKKDGGKAQAGVTQDQSPTVVEIYPVRGFKVSAISSCSHLYSY